MTVFNNVGCAMRTINPVSMAHPTFAAWALALLFSLLPQLTFAGGGDDHSHGNEVKAPIAATATGGPRLELKSPDVELLGILQDGKLTLYADRYASNEPIRNAKIELESGGRKVQAQAAQDGSYTVAADWLKQSGKPVRHSVVVSVQADGVDDLLIGSLEVPGTKSEAHGRDWLDTAKWAVGGIAAAILLTVLFKLMLRRKNVAASALLPLFAALLLGGHGNPSFAHGDEDHGDKPKSTPAAAALNNVPAAAQAAPVRLPDGSIFAPKPVQRLLGIRTMLGEQRDIAKTVELNGHISADPNFSGRVQSSQSGRIAAPAGGFPTIGMKVNKGQILAYIEPAASNIDKGNQQAQLAELASNLVLAEQRTQRLEQLVGSVPRKEIDAARAEAASLKARKAAVAASLFQREALRAPVSGMVSRADVVAGQVVEAREVLFEVIDPARLRVEAVAYDTALAGQVAGASAVTAGNQPLALTFIGQSYQLREQALPMQFGIQAPVPALSVGQPVKVLVQTRQTIRGIPVPQGSVTKNSSGETTVWLHASAERFVPQKVKVQALDANTVAVLEGLHDGDRVVAQGAALLSQIR
ncbi:MAG: HlyD family efflux transporter periplasmic adaptor subunit [Sulfurimicrobium sp.]|nr:HlyD family efflux transporter periplasmic adaptor subunit [Sulfurimicrobium sp.]